MLNLEKIYDFSVEDCVLEIRIESEDSLWIQTGGRGKVLLLRCLLSRDKPQVEVVDSCQCLSAQGSRVAYATESHEVIIRSTVDLTIERHWKFPESMDFLVTLCLMGDSIVIATTEGVVLRDISTGEDKLLWSRKAVPNDICVFGKNESLIIANWELCSIDTSSAEVVELDFREYDLDYPFYRVSNFRDKLLAVSSAALEIYNEDLKYVGVATDVPVVQAVFVDEFNLIARVGGDYYAKTGLEEFKIEKLSDPSQFFNIKIAPNATAIASSPDLGLVAIANGNRIAIYKKATEK